MSRPTAPPAEYYVAGSYQQQYARGSAGVAPNPADGSGGVGSAAADRDEAYAHRLQQEEFRNAQQQPLPTVAGLPMRPADGTQYVTMYPAMAAFDPSDLGVTGNFIAPHEVRLMEAAALGRTIRLLSVLDGLILVLNYAFFPILLLMMFWGPLAGWLAGSRYSTGWTYAYVCYYILRLSGDIAYIVSGTGLIFLWFILTFCINLIIARYILQFAKVLNSLTPAEIEQLRNPAAVWGGPQNEYRRGQPFQML